MKNNGEQWKALDIQDPGIHIHEAINIKSRVFCVKCGRVAHVTNENGEKKYQCLGGHWMKYIGGGHTTTIEAPASWAETKIIDPNIKIAEIEGVYCIHCGRMAFQIGEEIRFECPYGHLMDYRNADQNKP